MSAEANAQLPVRLVPRRGQAVFQLFFMLFWCGFLIYWSFAFVPQFLSNSGAQSLREFTAEHFILLIPVVMFAFGIFGLVRRVMALLPGSPYIYLSLTRDELAWRHFGTNHRAAWAEIKAFDVTREKSGKSYKWVLLVGGVASDRNTATLFKLDLRHFLSAFGGKKEATDVTDWFNSLLGLVNAGRLPERVPIPENLAVNLSRPQDVPRTGATIATSSGRRNSVIER
jgi:hypothetical protein